VVGAATAAALLLVLFVAGLTFANSIGASRVAGNAASLHWANSASGNASLTRAAITQAATFATLHASGMATDEDLAFALEQVDASIADLETLLDSSDASPSAAHLVAFVAGAQEAREAVATSSPAEAATVIEALESRYVELSDALAGEQAAVQEAIAANTAAAARVNGYVVFVLTLAIPASAVLVYWRLARRQMRDLQARTEIEIEAERSLRRAKDTFLAGLSHDLRTPLTSIYGFAEILTDGRATDPAQTAELAQIIANEAAEMSRMVDDLLVVSRLQSTGVEVEMTPTKVSAVIESAVTPFERAGATVAWSPTGDYVVTDAARLRQIIVNLISNAVRHGGPNVGIEVSSGESTVDIEVWDDGPGVPEAQVGSLFDRFVHEGDEMVLTGSIGLGLGVASKLADMLGGSLHYQRFGARTYFVVTVPRHVVDDEDVPETVTESVSDVIRALSA
jgi:signal transduction histidine kinase